jgi:hypothetical protein
MKERLKRPFMQAGFSMEVEIVEMASSRLVVLIGSNTP